MPIYTAKLMTGTGAQHVEFVSRDIPNLTQCRMSEVPIHAKPDMTEIAYAGYKQNVDIFIAATLSQTTISCDHFEPTPPNVEITIDIPMPNIAFTFRKALTNDQMKKWEAAVEDYAFEEMVLDKANTVYILRNVPYSFTLGKLRHVANSTAKLPEGFCSVESAVAAYLLYAGVQGFLATNSYPFSRYHGDDEDDAEDDMQEDETGFRYYNISSKRFVEELVTSGKKVRVATPEPAADGEDDEDMLPQADPEEVVGDEEAPGTVFMNIGSRSEVYKAKPSPLPYLVNVGVPSAVPNLPGHVFPYFQGLIAADTSFIRTTALDLFFRLMGEEGGTCRDGYKNFRAAIVSFSYTVAGLCMSHILKGMSLALESQTQLFLLVEKGSYLGFCLLGGQYHLFQNAHWAPPRTRAELIADLGTIWSHDTTLNEMLTFLNARKTFKGGKQVGSKFTMRDVESPVGLATAIGAIVWNPDTELQEAEKKELTEMLTHLSFDQRYFAIGSVRRIVSLIEDLASPTLKPHFKEMPFYFSDHYHLYSKVDFRLLSAFGSQAPSPFSVSGDTFRIPAPDKADPASDVPPDSKRKKMHSFVVAWKPVHVAYADWKRVLDKKEVRFPLGERAKESRCTVHVEKARDTIWEALIKNIGALKRDGDDDTGKPAAKVSAFMPSVAADFDDLF